MPTPSDASWSMGYKTEHRIQDVTSSASSTEGWSVPQSSWLHCCWYRPGFRWPSWAHCWLMFSCSWPASPSLFCQAAFQLLCPKPVTLHGLVTQVQDLAVGHVESHPIALGPPIQPVQMPLQNPPTCPALVVIWKTTEDVLSPMRVSVCFVTAINHKASCSTDCC